MNEHDRALLALVPELVSIAQAYRNRLKFSACTEGDVNTFHRIEDLLTKAEHYTAHAEYGRTR